MMKKGLEGIPAPRMTKSTHLNIINNNNNNNNNNNIDSYKEHFYPQSALHYESLLKIVTFLAYVTLYIKYCKT